MKGPSVAPEMADEWNERDRPVRPTTAFFIANSHP